jgi:hypothetical protein
MAPRPSIQTARIPAPMGLNTVAGGSSMGDADALLLYNLIPGAYGLQIRSGYRQWCTNLSGAADNTVRSMLPFTGGSSNGSTNKLFAVTSTGIWDCSSSSSSPTQVLTFASSANNAGRGVATVVVTAAGHFMLYADEENGLFQYTESTNTWAVSTVSGINPSNVVSVMMWKHRVFLTEKDSTSAWYLDAGAVTGTATEFDFAQRFKAGGTLVGLWSWTYDGGAGLDDSLVAISQGGDVAIYQGSDPSDATDFGLRGIWQLGAVPAGRRIATDTGGDLLLISTMGALPASKLVVGGASFSSQYATAKIANEFTRLMSLYRGTQGWGLYQHPGDGALLVTVPEYGAQSATTQLAMSYASGGWSKYRDLPVVSGCVWEGDFYIGTADGMVCRAIDYVDNVDISDPESYDSIDWSLLTRYHNLGNANQKRVELIRPVVLSGQLTPSVSSVARYDYDLREASEASGSGSGGSGAWDSGVWDSSLWGADYIASNLFSGAQGMGRDVAIAMRGNALSKTTLVGIDVFYNQGGPL